MDEQPWVDVAADDEITPSSPCVVRLGRLQLAVLRDDDGHLHALNNRCPHEGYPLAQGYVRGCTLTCAWHNFKFDLRDGQCLMGDEPVGVFPVRVCDGRVQVDPREPADEGAVERGMARLGSALLERKLGQIARETVRLLELGVAPERLAIEAARFDAVHADYGSTHALPVATDILGYLPRYPGPSAALPLMQAFDLASEPNVRRPSRPLAEPEDPGDDPVAAGDRLRLRVRDEDGAGAEALLRGALARGWSRAQIEPWLLAPCFDHFLSFGHPLIYTIKTFDLLERVGWEHAEVVLPALLCRTVSATREDTLPRWRSFVAKQAAVEPKVSAWWATTPTTRTVAAMVPEQREAWWSALVQGHRDEAFDAIAQMLDHGCAPAAIADLVGAAAAARLLRLQLDHDGDDTVQEGWLDVTHTMTFADAVHHAVERTTDPTALRLLFQSARFVNNARTLDGPDATAQLLPSPAPTSVEAIRDSILGRRPHDAVAQVTRYLIDHGADDALAAMCSDLPLQDVYTRPIVIAHAIKTGRVAFELAARLQGTPWAHLPIAAFVRFAAAAPRERSVARLVHEAERLVVEGKVPRTLT
ncbi:MAG: Rieske 2Fe-2S domain-containing protein [Deltaproteobacteria bacterium]|nr:Rieske 2Fe-2S domain-containing protein [Deltaproteobacteria bacterium]